MGFPGGSDGKESAHNAGDRGLIPGSGRSPGGGNGNPLQCSCLGNPIDRRAWWAAVHGISKELDMTERLHNNNGGDADLISGSGRSPGGGNGNPLQYSCLGNSMDRGTWWLESVGSKRVDHD